MPRRLDTATLDNAARDYAGAFLLPSVFSQYKPDLAIGGRDWVIQNFHNIALKDSFEHVLGTFKQYIGPKALTEFEAATADVFTPRDDAMFAALLAEHLAVDPDGNHIEGKIGKVIHGARVVGRRPKVFTSVRGIEYIVPKQVYWPVYAGEGEERAAGRVKDHVGADGPGADPLPATAEPLPVGAFNTRISNECAILACDAVVDNLDEGTGAAVLQGRTGAQPADPDTAPTGTLLFTLVYSANAFGGAVDNTGSARATANAITDDTAADATGTVGYCRVSSTSDSLTPLDDHLDGEAGTVGADFNFNTTSIVLGATVAMTSHTVDMPES